MLESLGGSDIYLYRNRANGLWQCPSPHNRDKCRRIDLMHISVVGNLECHFRLKSSTEEWIGWMGEHMFGGGGLILRRNAVVEDLEWKHMLFLTSTHGVDYQNNYSASGICPWCSF